MCFLVAGWMTYKQIKRYYDNLDVTAISYKTFQSSPSDKFPTYTICFNDVVLQGIPSGALYDSDYMVKTFGISGKDYSLILRGIVPELNVTNPKNRTYPKDIKDINHRLTTLDIRNHLFEFEAYYARGIIPDVICSSKAE